MGDPVATPKNVNPLPEGEVFLPGTDDDGKLIIEQLHRLLGSPVFGRSKGCSNLLGYIVTRTLQGDAEHLKERTIGTQVFGRAADYDTASDHVVRSTAGEVRKRLAQYYMEPGHSREVRIDIPSGSYVPRFTRFPASLDEPLRATEEIRAAAASGAGPSSAIPRKGRYRLFAILVGLVAVTVILVMAARVGTTRFADSTLARFWAPVIQAPNPVVLCIGDFDASAQIPQAGSPRSVGVATNPVLPDRAFGGSRSVFLNDAITLARIVGLLQRDAKQYSILPHSTVTFADLQNGPAVLIGLRNNYWTSSLAGPLRFRVEQGATPNILILRDNKNPLRNDWSVDMLTPYSQPAKDYAIITREVNTKTGQIAVTIGGITRHGTLAASEFVTNPEQIKRLDAYCPRGCEDKNIAIVLSTDVIRGSPGIARIVAVDFW